MSSVEPIYCPILAVSVHYKIGYLKFQLSVMKFHLSVTLLAKIV